MPMRAEKAVVCLSDMPQADALVQPLLAWYRARARVLPWREQPTPYRVWISEIMLQQTRVEAVKPYFDRFITALPNPQALAAVSEDSLLKLWEGLGYYNRARNLQKAAVQIISEYGGELPADYDELLKLPGIGPYTAGAIASIAYHIPMPAVDGNVLRVVSRLLASPHDITSVTVRQAIGRFLEQILPPQSPGDFNQALMELGATVCLPKAAARCFACPLVRLCLAKAQECVAALPCKAPRKARRIEERTVFLLLFDGKAAFRRREPHGLLAGLWELPHTEGRLTAEQARRYLADHFGFSACGLAAFPEAKHIFTHMEWHMSGYAAVAERVPVSDNAALHWIDGQMLANGFAIPSAFKPFTARLRFAADGRFYLPGF